MSHINTSFQDRQQIMKDAKCSECGKPGKEICEECFEKAKAEFMQRVEQSYKDLGLELKSKSLLKQAVVIEVDTSKPLDAGQKPKSFS